MWYIIRAMNKSKCSGEKPRNPTGWLKNYWSIAALILLTILLLVCAWPNSSAIYFNGAADHAVFTFSSGGRDIYSVKSDSQYNGKIVFGFNETELMYVANTSMSEEEIQQIREEGFSDWETSNEVFPFNEGIATLSSKSEYESESKSLMTIILESPNGGSFTYDMEITCDEGDGNGEWNRIELKNFPEDLLILLHSGLDIDMDGTTKKIPQGLYWIIGCTSITFYAVPAVPEDRDIGYDPRLKGTLESFQFTNTERDTFETTYQAETNFIEIGHVEMKGCAEDGKPLMLEISDIGQYPLPVKLSGQVGTLEMGGVNCYPAPKQWLLEKRSELLLSIAGLFIGLMFKKAEKKTEEKKLEEKNPEPKDPEPEDPEPKNLEKENLEPDNPVKESES